MKNVVKTLMLLFAAVSLPFTGVGQTLKTIALMEQAHLQCLDSGIGMTGCADSYRLQMDSLLNVVYNKLRKRLPTTEKDKLKTEQLAWLKQRDRHFKEQEQDYKTNISPEDWTQEFYLIVYSSDAEFIKERVVYLIKRLEKSKGE
jgi:uncharacterized protein YecT (DUF1311 family)